MSSIDTTYSDIKYWDYQWQINNIDFHRSANHPFLEKYLEKLTQNKAKVRILFPFCGKAVDMAWLASMGHEIVGVEFVQEACEQFYAENGIKYTVKDLKDFKMFTSQDGRIKLYNGDFLKFNSDLEEEFECVWDRGALVAQPSDLRKKYSEHIQKLLAPDFRYLLDAFDYDQELYPGPPHSVTLEEIQSSYGSKCKIELIDSTPYKPFNEAQAKANQPTEKLYLLTKL